jgi:hypothetical protein
MAKINNQKPTFSAGIVPVSGVGHLAIELAEEYGFAPDPWQRTVVKQAFSDGVVQIGISAPRQNGKNGILEVIELFSSVVDAQSILHTSHQMVTAIEQYDRMRRRWFENPHYPDLVAGCKVVHGRGSEAFEIDNGATIKFLSRSSVRGRGFSVDWLILDEAQEMSEDDWQALSPTLLASPNAKIFLLGTPPISSRQGQGVVFQRFRTAAYEGKLEKGEIYFEWGITDLEKADVYSEKTWYRVNPAYDYRINEALLRINARQMDKEGFAREHLGYWYKSAKNTIYSEDQWAAGLIGKRPAYEEVERFGVGIVYAQDGETWAAAFGAVLKDGSLYAELIDLASTKKGMTQILQIIAAMSKKTGFVGVIAHGRAGTQNLIGDAEASGLFKADLIEICRHADKIASNGFLDMTMRSAELKHVDQAPLKESLLSLDKYLTNSSGGGFSYISRIGKLIASEAAALAVYWARNKKPRVREKKQRIWL